MRVKLNMIPRTLLAGMWYGMAVGAFAGEAKVVPAAFPLERYQPLMARSPFSLATEGAPQVGASGFARDLVLTGVVRLNGGEFVTVVSRDQSVRFGLMRGESRNGISIAGVAWSDVAGKTRVTLRRGDEYGVIGFDEAVAAGASGGRGNQGAPSTPAAGAGASPRVIKVF